MLNSILDLQWYFKANKIPYVMYHGLPGEINLTYNDHKLLWNTVDTDNFYSPLKSHAEFINQFNLFVSAEDYHPNEQGHRDWADYVTSFIKNLYPLL